MTSSSDGLIALCAKRINELQAAFAKLSKLPGPQGERGETGPQGVQGQVGARGEIGPAGRDGKDGARGEIGPAGRDGKDGARGPAGPRGPKGEQGERGPMPDHEWSGSRLRFQKPDGEWGKFVQLRGPKGDAGAAGSSGGGYSIGGSGFDPSDAATTPTVQDGDEMLILRAGVVYRVGIQLAIGGDVPTNAVIVNGQAVTVNGQYVVKT